MVFWPVTGKPRVEKLVKLRRRTDSREIPKMRPFGREFEYGLLSRG